jgi:hypothetical protein
MLEQLFFTISAANGDDDQGNWMQFLVFIIMAVIWSIGGIAKVKSSKAAQKDQEPSQKKTRRPGIPDSQKRPVQAGPVIRKPITYQPVIEKIEPLDEISEIFEPEIEPLKELNNFKPIIKKTEPKSITQKKSILSIDNKDDLRKAILHYEILGKPKALRDF